MKSLMQQFAEARQQRLLEQQQRQQDTAALLFQAERDRQVKADLYRSQRLANEQNRRQIAKAERSIRNYENQQRVIDARLDARERQQQIIERKRYIGDRLREFQAQQQITAQNLKQQFRQLNAHLAALRQARLTQAEVNTQVRLAAVIVRVASVRLQMASIHQNRMVTEKRDRQARSDFRQQQIIETAQLMQQIRNEIQDLQRYIWGDSIYSTNFGAVLAEPSLIQVAGVNSNPESVPDLIIDPVEVEIAFTNRVNPELNSGEVERFILSYVSKLENPMPLAQLVSDREVVKSLLSEGSSSLNIDPSEVLNVLLKMVETK
jgi:hypothetical protein